MKAWYAATLRKRILESASGTTLRLEIADWPGHLAGQHLDVRLRAPDGYTASRSYSIASSPTEDFVDITVQRVDDGEVSPYLHDVLPVAAQVEVSRPRGGFFVWRGDAADPVLLVAGGSGVVPLMAMLRTRIALPGDFPGAAAPFHLVYSARTPEDVFYGEELAALQQEPGVVISYVFTRRASDGQVVGRLGPERNHELREPGPGAAAYVCGPNAFVETVASLLLDLGHEPERIRLERFGPSG